MKKLLLTCAVAAGLSAAPAQAALITAANVGDSGTVTFNGNVGGNNVAGLTAAITFTLDTYDIVNEVIVFTVSVANTSSAPITASRVAAFGFDTAPNVTGGSSTSTIFDDVNVDTDGAPPHQQFPNGFGNIEVCVIDNANNCTGGGGGGVELGDPAHSFQLTLNFLDLTAAGFDFTNFGVRYQSIDGPNLNGASGTGMGGPGGTLFNVTPVPEPASLVMLGLGLLGAGIARRRRA